MNDLLGNVKGGPGGAPQPPPLFDGPPTAPPSDSHDKMLDDFFGQVAAIKERLAGIREIQKDLLADNERSKVITRREEMSVVRNKMQEKVNQVSKEALGIKARLEKLEKDNHKALQQPKCGPGSSSERIRSATTGALRQKLVELMNEFQALNTRLKNEYRETVGRRVYTVTGREANPSDVEQLIETGESERIFQRAIMEQGRGQVADTMAEIRERHDAVQDLERSLLDLHQIFMDMAVLVEAQGEMLDNIENQVARAVDYVEAGTTALVDAKQSQKGKRKLMCCLLITVLIILGIIAGIIAWQVTK
mmetsp:Transcript_668/g.1938  ORF Transcript_668/g.1938 Transcript_668/m.1938 type:complete len:306 (+) Transcript_668:281-1198(+)|eukprot:CAMPEP_0206146712 /NCGR_PEP_ID=MMETSP1473-20131121/31197_1 /ASSEMBLY_ACC=CAM_ASM_001109 /TAXON_ID=1461547 /ORGANISM="Stichococcus sp, Strain RCC1054" /LENGTH=305 /DNA_ID=CAMNT_0053543373 /DNA_START=221 /DNA_END=1138 /DNA_ORIENTATION=-